MFWYIFAIFTLFFPYIYSLLNFHCACADELIRQVTINCTERGLLLLRIRDEIAMSMEAYDTLYSSSVAFGLRKALQSEDSKEKLLERVTLLEVLFQICLEFRQHNFNHVGMYVIY